MTNRYQDLNLKPRAIAALCALRGGSRTVTQVRNAIGDESTASTRDLLGDMRDLKLVQMAGQGFWYLVYEGIGWLETNGLPVSVEAKRAAVNIEQMHPFAK